MNRILAENSQHGIAVFSLEETRVLFANPALIDIVGMPLEQLLGLRGEQLFHLVSSEDLEKIQSIYYQHVQGNTEPRRYEMRIVRPDGKMKWLLNRAHPIVFDGKNALEVLAAHFFQNSPQVALSSSPDHIVGIRFCLVQILEVKAQDASFDPLHRLERIHS